MARWCMVGALYSLLPLVHLERQVDTVDEYLEEQGSDVYNANCKGELSTFLGKELDANSRPQWAKIEHLLRRASDGLTSAIKSKEQLLSQKKAHLEELDGWQANHASEQSEIEEFLKKTINSKDSVWGSIWGKDGQDAFAKVKEFECGNARNNIPTKEPDKSNFREMLMSREKVLGDIATKTCEEFGSKQEEVKADELKKTCEQFLGCEDICQAFADARAECDEGLESRESIDMLRSDTSAQIQELEAELAAERAELEGCQQSDASLKDYKKEFAATHSKVRSSKQESVAATQLKQWAELELRQVKDLVDNQNDVLEKINNTIQECDDSHGDLKKEYEQVQADNQKVQEACDAAAEAAVAAADAAQKSADAAEAVEELKIAVKSTLTQMHSFYDGFVLEPFRKLSFPQPEEVPQWQNLKQSINSLSEKCKDEQFRAKLKGDQDDAVLQLCAVGDQELIKEDIKSVLQKKTGAIMDVLEKVEGTSKIFKSEGTEAGSEDKDFHDILTTVSSHAAELTFYKEYLIKWKSNGPFEALVKGLHDRKAEASSALATAQEEQTKCTAAVAENEKKETELLENVNKQFETCEGHKGVREGHLTEFNNLMNDLMAKEQALNDAMIKEAGAFQELYKAEEAHAGTKTSVKEKAAKHASALPSTDTKAEIKPAN
eukprot:gb/GFBE01021736.1/.p1 GENE.gb/GFBE01021736.1/~~gb/GFBE01021736.1/.p1  ORF type:complete len:664 (+),score=220.07 gb/GFBE01021736.1/:1-1992(+)